jgi:hypothetical protein
MLRGGTVSANSPLQILGGILGGSGTVLANVTSSGLVSPGASPGLLTISGNYTQAVSGTLTIELAGVSPGSSYDRLAVTGTAALAGTLNLTLTNGFYPAPNAEFVFLTAGARIGNFGTFNYPSNDVGMQLAYAAVSASAQVINVRPVPPPLADQTNDELVVFRLNAAGTDADVPPQTLTYALTNSPPGVTIDPNGLISWTPTEEQGPMVTNITVLVTDNGTPNLTVSRTFGIVINEINVAPVLTLPLNPAVDEQTLFTATATATDSDRPANPLTFELVSGPPGLTVSTNGDIAWNPTEEQGPNVYIVTVRVTDSNTNAVNEQHLSTTNSFLLTVNEVNRPPVLTVPTNQVMDELTTLSVSASATDPDIPANPLTFSLASAPEGMTINTNTGAITWTPTEAQGPSSNFVLVVVTDLNTNAVNQQQLSVTNGFSVVVNEVNQPPVLMVPTNQVVDEMTTLSVSASATDPDIPPNPLTFSLALAPEGMTINTNSGAITWTPTEAQGPSSNFVLVVVTDLNTNAVNQQQLSVTNGFGVVVNEVNQPPVLMVPTHQLVDEMTTLSVSASATVPDMPANPLTFGLALAPEGMTINTNTGAITWTPTEAQGPSSNFVLVVVTDLNTNAVNQQQLSVTNGFSVVVNEVNQPPVPTVPTNQVMDELTTLSVSASATDPDIPPNPLAFSLASAPEGMTINTNTGAITWTPTEAQGPSSNFVLVVVTDLNTNAVNQQQLSVTNGFSVVVDEVNASPVLTVPADQIIHAAFLLSVVATATDADIPTNTLRFGLASGPAGLSVSSNGLVSWRPPDALAGTTNQVSVWVLDNGSPAMGATQSFNVIVLSRPVLATPVITDDEVALSWSAIPRTSYRVQSNPELGQDMWTDLAGDVTATTTNASKTFPKTNSTVQMYRVRVLP